MTREECLNFSKPRFTVSPVHPTTFVLIDEGWPGAPFYDADLYPCEALDGQMFRVREHADTVCRIMNAEWELFVREEIKSLSH